MPYVASIEGVEAQHPVHRYADLGVQENQCVDILFAVIRYYCHYSPVSMALILMVTGTEKEDILSVIGEG